MCVWSLRWYTAVFLANDGVVFFFQPLLLNQIKVHFMPEQGEGYYSSCFYLLIAKWRFLPLRFPQICSIMLQSSKTQMRRVSKSSHFSWVFQCFTTTVDGYGTHMSHPWQQVEVVVRNAFLYALFHILWVQSLVVFDHGNPCNLTGSSRVSLFLPDGRFLVCVAASLLLVQMHPLGLPSMAITLQSAAGAKQANKFFQQVQGAQVRGGRDWSILVFAEAHLKCAFWMI